MFGVKITYEVNGRRTDPRNIGDALLGAVIRRVGEDLSRELDSIKCPVHGSHPAVRVAARSSNSMALEIESCCKELSGMALQHIQ
ncbi:MAG: hypothetical protein ACJ8AO_06240 [Gemmatimonadaceae bacterium]|jgi:hypothetical protein